MRQVDVRQRAACFNQDSFPDQFDGFEMRQQRVEFCGGRECSSDCAKVRWRTSALLLKAELTSFYLTVFFVDPDAGRQDAHRLDRASR
jgi:hypothetical protein